MGDFATLDARQQENPDYAIMDERATDPAYYGKQYAIAVRKDDPELLNAINDAPPRSWRHLTSSRCSRSGLNNAEKCTGPRTGPGRGLQLNEVFAVVSQLGDRLADIVHRLMSALLFKTVENFRLPAARQLFQRANVR